jgi:cytoskeletal protein CcmA (bactofilin family)
MVLAVAALALVCIFTAAGVSTMNLRLSTHSSNQSIAENLAESVVQQALANLQEDLGFTGDITINDDPDLPDGAKAYLTFQDDRGVPYCSNNLLGENSDGWQRRVPNKMIHLVGVGECGGVTRHVEVVAHAPEFPLGVACGGTIKTKNCLISSFEPKDDREWEPGSGYSVKEEELEPGHIATNSDRADSVVLDPATRVTGDIQSRGDVDINGASVEGDVRPRWGRKAPIPTFNFEDFDPAKSDNTYYEKLTSPGTDVTIIGNMKYSGSLVVMGDLRLDNGFLYVDGPLTVNGELSGEGALVTTGRATFKASSSLASNKDIAVLAKDGVTVTGDGPGRSVFRGLVYTTGSFEARKLTIVGGFVVNGDHPTDLKDLYLYYSSKSVSPAIKRQSFAVVPRFLVPSAEERDADLEEEPSTGYPYGEWQRFGRNPANVLDVTRTDFLRSDWQANDPAVLDVRWVNGQPVYRYRFWGHYDDSGYVQDAAPGGGHEFSTPEALAEYWATENTTGPTGVYLENDVGITPPNKALYKQYLIQVLGHLEKNGNASLSTTYRLEINEFINEVEPLRIVLHRTF